MGTVYLDRNESQYGPAPACYDVLRNAGRDELSTYTRDFDRGVKSRVSERLAATLGMPEKNIILGYGAECLLKMAIHRYLPTGQKLMVPDASWWYYGSVAREVGAETCTYPVIPHGNRYFYSEDAMVAAYQEHRPRVVLIASPNNPTGNSMPEELLRRVLSRFGDAIVVLDEAYWGYDLSGESHATAIVQEFDNVIILRSFSKYYALAGVRMGYAICSDRFQDFADYTTLFLGYQQLAENLVLAAMDSDEYYADIARKMEEDKDLFYRTLAPYDSMTCFRSDASFLLIRFAPELVDPLKKRLGLRGLKPKFFTEPMFLHHMRLSLGTQEQNRAVLEEIVAVAEEGRRASMESLPVAV